MVKMEIKALMIEPGKHPVVVMLNDDLDSLQKAVSIGADYQGLIEIIGIGSGDCILCNEEGKLIGLEGNRRVGSDIIAGVFYIMSEGEDGELVSLREEKIKYYTEKFWERKCLAALRSRLLSTSGSSEPYSKKRMPWAQDILFFSFSLEFQHQVCPNAEAVLERFLLVEAAEAAHHFENGIVLLQAQLLQVIFQVDEALVDLFGITTLVVRVGHIQAVHHR